jgi:hypothetical protein
VWSEDFVALEESEGRVNKGEEIAMNKDVVVRKESLAV